MGDGFRFSDELLQRTEYPASLMILDEEMLARLADDPSRPLTDGRTKGFSYEEQSMYPAGITLDDILKAGKAAGATRLDVSYDFFFGGGERTQYPDSPLTIRAYKAIHDRAAAYGLGFCASIISPLDTGGGYVKEHASGQVMQIEEGEPSADGYCRMDVTLQRQWTNNKGPVPLTLRAVRAFAYPERWLPGTALYAVNEEDVREIGPADIACDIDRSSFAVSAEGYGYGKASLAIRVPKGCDRCLAVLVYDSCELDYFADDALPYMTSLIDRHAAAGITYCGFYSDEMHIQFDWDRHSHFGETEARCLYMTEAFAAALADASGAGCRNFARYLVYFTYGRRTLPDGTTRFCQHVCGERMADIVRTFDLRRTYYALLHRRVADLCRQTRDYAARLFGRPMITLGHTTWEEPPTCDQFFPGQLWGESVAGRSLYEYTKDFVYSSTFRENRSACADHFVWNDYLCTVGTDIPEGGYLDRNYYGAAVTASLAVLNDFPFAYYCIWGSPEPVKRRQADIGQAFGHYAAYWSGYEWGHHLIQGFTARISEVLTVCPDDLNCVEERFGTWQVQYGYTDYITEDKLLAYGRVGGDGRLYTRRRSYGTLVVLYSPLASTAFLQLAARFLGAGGTVIWCGPPAMREKEAALWRQLFGVQEYLFSPEGMNGEGMTVTFPGFSSVRPQQIRTDLLPDRLYPVLPAQGRVAACVGALTVGVQNGRALYLGLRPRDDQSGSLGEDTGTLFTVLTAMDAYDPAGPEALSRPQDSPYLYTRFPNGAVSAACHMRHLEEGDWQKSFYRDAETDARALEAIRLTPVRVELEQKELFGHLISTAGDGIVSWRLGEAGRLIGFAAKATAGITVDGREYRFAEVPSDIVFARLDGEVPEGDGPAWAARCSTCGCLTLPFDAAGCLAGSSADWKGRELAPLSFETHDGQTVVNVTEELAGRYLFFWRPAERSGHA